MEKKFKPLDLGYSMPFGQYKGNTVEFVCKKDPQYIMYLSGGNVRFTKRVLELAKAGKKTVDYHNYRNSYYSTKKEMEKSGVKYKKLSPEEVSKLSLAGS